MMPVAMPINNSKIINADISTRRPMYFDMGGFLESLLFMLTPALNRLYIINSNNKTMTILMIILFSAAPLFKYLF